MISDERKKNREPFCFPSPFTKTVIALGLLVFFVLFFSYSSCVANRGNMKQKHFISLSQAYYINNKQTNKQRVDPTRYILV